MEEENRAFQFFRLICLGHKSYKKSRMKFGWTLWLLKLAGVGNTEEKEALFYELRMSTLLKIQLQKNMIGALGARKRSDRSFCTAVLWLESCHLPFPITPVKCFKTLSSSSFLCKAHNLLLTLSWWLYPLVLKEKSQCLKFPPIYLPSNLLRLYAHTQHLYIYFRYLKLSLPFQS